MVKKKKHYQVWFCVFFNSYHLFFFLFVDFKVREKNECDYFTSHNIPKQKHKNFQNIQQCLIHFPSFYN